MHVINAKKKKKKKKTQPDGDRYKCSKRDCSGIGAEPRYQLAFIGGDPDDVKLPEDPTVEFICFGAIAEEMIGAPVDALIDAGGGIGVHTPEHIKRLCGRQYEFRVSIPQGALQRDRLSFKVDSILNLTVIPAPSFNPESTGLDQLMLPESSTTPATNKIFDETDQIMQASEKEKQEVVTMMSPPPQLQTPEVHSQTEKRTASPRHNDKNETPSQQSDRKRRKKPKTARKLNLEDSTTDD